MAGKGAARGVRQGGRKPGVPNKLTVATRERIEREADPIGFLTRVMKGEAIEGAPLKDGPGTVLMFPTVDQRLSAARILADKQIPNARDRTVSVEIPKVESAADVVAALGAILDAAADGRITPAEASTLAGIIETRRRAIESVELERRVSELEQRSAKQ